MFAENLSFWWKIDPNPLLFHSRAETNPLEIAGLSAKGTGNKIWTQIRKGLSKGEKLAEFTGQLQMTFSQMTERNHLIGKMSKFSSTEMKEGKRLCEC